MHPNLGKFIVEKPSGVRPGQMVYLYKHGYKDGSGRIHRDWVVYIEEAQVYKLRANADKAAARWGGTVKRLDV